MVQTSNSKKQKPNSKKTLLEHMQVPNLWFAGAYIAQGLAILLLSANRTFPVTANYLTNDPFAAANGHTVLVSSARHLFDVNLAYVVVAFLFASAVMHALIATKYRAQYEADLKQGFNKFRWIEYGFSASAMLVVIGLISGVQDFVSLVMIVSLMFVTSLLALAYEVYGKSSPKMSWLSYWLVAIPAKVPWLVIAYFLFAANVYGGADIPPYVYGAYVINLLFFAVFGLVMWRQRTKTGKWADYQYSEKVYSTLGFLAKTTLAWLVFAGLLHS